MAKICFITAIYGNYEFSCKKFCKQTVETDFICFTDNKDIVSNGWIIDTLPYHFINKSKIDNDSYINSLSNNKHTFNIAKYYKQQFQNIPRLSSYDVIVWLDRTIEIINENTSNYLLNNINAHNIITWDHTVRRGELLKEVIDSNFDKYTSTTWGNQKQPFQDVPNQYNDYIANGYDVDFYNKKGLEGIGVWITCFVAFANNKSTTNFLDMWYLQTLKYTTQDQVGFPYVCQKFNTTPYTLPNNEIKAYNTSIQTDFYRKHNHGY